MSKVHVCPFCEVGKTEEVSFSEVLKVGRKSVLVQGLKKCVCAACGSESVPGDLHDANVDLMEMAQAQVKGLVPLSSLRALREQWDLSQKTASLLFGAGPSSFGKWESGQSNMSTPAALLIKVALQFPVVMRYLAKLAGVTLGDVAVNSMPPAFGAYETVHLSREAMNGKVFAIVHAQQKSHATETQNSAAITQEWRQGLQAVTTPFGEERLLEAA
jgi:putative zinc finger/helix-turn-helix YgiT family protein